MLVRELRDAAHCDPVGHRVDRREFHRAPGPESGATIPILIGSAASAAPNINTNAPASTTDAALAMTSMASSQFLFVFPFGILREDALIDL